MPRTRRPPPPMMIGRMGPAVTAVGAPDRPGDVVVLAREGGRPGRPQGLHDGQALGHAADPDAGRVVGDARLLVVGGHPARPQAELHPALGEQVEGGDLLGQHDRVAVVVAEHQGADPQVGGGLGGHGQGHQGPELVLEVVGDEQGRVAEVLDRAGQCPARRPRRGVGQLDAEAEGGHVPSLGPEALRCWGGTPTPPSDAVDRGPLTRWRAQPAAQQPVWPDEAELKQVHARLSGLPPLVFAGEARHLTRALGQAADGRAFVLQAGDCAESFSEFTADGIRDKLKVILQMAVVLTYGAGVPVVKVGRIAGQFAKPRSSPTEQVGDQVIDSFRGHMVNDDLPERAARVPDPARLVDRLRAVGGHPQPAAGLHQGRLRRPQPDPRLEPGVRGHLHRGPPVRGHRRGHRPRPAVHGRLRHQPHRRGHPAPGRLLDQPRGAHPRLRGGADPAGLADRTTGTTARPTCCGSASGPASSTAPTVEFLSGIHNPVGSKIGPDGLAPTTSSPCASGSTPTGSPVG